MSLLNKMIYVWHLVRRNYYKELVESCIDCTLKAKLRNKFEYHAEKLAELSLLKAS
ncbi:hypothetical protein [Metabacillus schmidteae]|uniref:hypothetical protein n=1 Tax=Metabacillus schmidteae TaxID=2730405 RepID=UPI00158A4F16|nr:hypothetical protein [Metabacillus schmidteae]